MIATMYSTLSGKLAGKHPTLGVLVREDGLVKRPRHGGNKLVWTKGTINKTRSGNGYYRVRIGSDKKAYVHVLVAETFIDNPSHKTQVDHENRIRTDNRVQNLRWVTPSENSRNTSSYLNADNLGVRWCEDSKEANRRYMKKKRENSEFRRMESEKQRRYREKKKAERSAQPS